MRLDRPVAETDEVVTAFRDGTVDLRSARREDGYTMSDTEHGYQGVEPGDLVFHALDGFAGAIGVSRARGKCSPVYHVCRPVGEGSASYFAYSLRAMAYSGFLALQAGTVRQRSVDFRNWDALARLPIPHPPPAHQRQVADFLDLATTRIETLVEKKRRMVGLLDEYRVAATDIAILGAEGTPRPVSALADYLNGWPFKPGDFTDDGLPVIRIRQLVDPDAEMDRYDGELPDRVKLRDGDLVFSWSGSLEVRPWNRGNAYLNQHLFRVVPRSGIGRRWLRYALDSATRLFQEHMHGSAMTHITLPMLKQVRIPVPTADGQESTTSHLDQIWERCERMTHKLSHQTELLNEHREALVTSAVTGEISSSVTA